VLYRAIERYGSPEALVTDGGGIFRSHRAHAVYEALGIRKEESERGKPWHKSWQSYVETMFNIQRRMADWHFSLGQKAGRSWWRRTRSGLRTTTSRATEPIAREGTAAARLTPLA
jgi:hypothetical protein